MIVMCVETVVSKNQVVRRLEREHVAGMDGVSAIISVWVADDNVTPSVSHIAVPGDIAHIKPLVDYHVANALLEEIRQGDYADMLWIESND